MNINSSNPLFDFIGDIHGHANELKLLLDKLGYTIHNGSYTHPTRKAFFVGDYIDRGLQIIGITGNSGERFCVIL